VKKSRSLLFFSAAPLVEVYYLLFKMSFAAGAFARTRRALGPTKDVPVAMVKWWKKVKDTNGEVRFAVLLQSASRCKILDSPARLISASLLSDALTYLHSQPLAQIFLSFVLLY